MSDQSNPESAEPVWTVDTALDAICAGDSGEFWNASMEKPAREATAYLHALEARLASAEAERDDYARRLKATAEAWNECALARDSAEAALKTATERADRAEQRYKAWEDAMTDVSVINWTLSESNAGHLHAQLMDVIAQNVQEQLDPTVSQQAAALATERSHAADLLAALRTMEAMRDCWRTTFNAYCPPDLQEEAQEYYSIAISAAQAEQHLPPTGPTPTTPKEDTPHGHA